jgi:pimeloyl-ACP methyl ester carboxylesterase
MGSDLTPRVEAWRRQGAVENVRGYRLFVRRREGEGPLLLFLHGFPSSSYDWRGLLPALEGRATLCFDFLGFGLSEKPRGRDYSLFEQADLAKELVGDGAGPVIAIGHDMGTSVATELMARDIDGTLGFDLRGVLVFNGSMVAELASLTLAQKLLLGRAGPLAARLANRRFFAQQLGGVFSDAHPLTDEEAADQWSLVRAGGGRTLGHRQVAYYRERIEHADRWHGALREWPGELHYAWGLRDPVATPVMLRAVRELRPGAPVTELPELGHYPQIEEPSSILAALRRLVESPQE